MKVHKVHVVKPTDVFFSDGYFNKETKLNFRGDKILGPMVATQEWITALHVGKVPFVNNPYATPDSYRNNFESAALDMLYLLYNNYRIVLYTGTRDLLIPYAYNRLALQRLVWYRDWVTYFYLTSQTAWQVDGADVGLVKSGKQILFGINFRKSIMKTVNLSVGPLTEIHLDGAGHLATVDQPIVLNSIFDKFVCNRKFQ